MALLERHVAGASRSGPMLCKVCGDKASGKHYGVPSCDGCRGFFKRSIRRNLDYVCKERGCCVVDVARRNQCQACRFRKCLQANMRKDAVQHERAPRCGAPGSSCGGVRRSSPGASMSFSLACGPPPELSPAAAAAAALLLAAPPSYLAPPPPPVLLAPSLCSAFHVAPPSNAHHEREEHVSSSGADERADQEAGGGVREAPAGPRASLAHLLECASESAARLLFIAVKWARSMPSFLQLLPRDQETLLEAAWGQLFVLTAAQWAFPIDEETLLSGAVAPASRHRVLADEARVMRGLIGRCSLLRVDHTEYACLKALALFRPESRGVREVTRAEALQEQTQLLLGEYCSAGQRCEAAARRRLGRLLLLLPATRRPPPSALQELFFRQTVGDVPIERLLGDMLKAGL